MLSAFFSCCAAPVGRTTLPSLISRRTAAVILVLLLPMPFSGMAAPKIRHAALSNGVARSERCARSNDLAGAAAALADALALTDPGCATRTGRTQR
jgi:hypothetical protein